MFDVLHTGLSVLGDISVGNAKQPPGTEKLSELITWALWIVSFLGVLGVFITAGAMMVAHRRGEGGETAGRLGWVLGGCVLAVAAGPMVNMLI